MRHLELSPPLRTVEAAAAIDTVLRIDERSVEGFFCKGVISASMGEFVSGMNHQTRAIELDEKYAPAYLLRSALYKLCGDRWTKDCKRAYELDNTLRFA